MVDIDSEKASKSAMERFGVENGVKVCTMRWLRQLRLRGQHPSVVIKVAIKEDIVKLITSDKVSFREVQLLYHHSKSDAPL